MVRFVPLLLVAPAAMAFQIPQGRSTVSSSFNTASSRPAVAIGTDSATGMPIPQSNNNNKNDDDGNGSAGAMIDLTGVAMSVS